MPRGVLEIGGTHVSAALVSPDGVVSHLLRRPLRAEASAEEFTDAVVAAAAGVCPAPGDWAVAIPGPFDYALGIGRFESVGKFDALRGFALGAALAARLGGRVTFVNDADAFALGCWVTSPGVRRLVGLTLGSGVGSGWIRDGVAVTSGDVVPPAGSVHQLSARGAPLEAWVSRRAIVGAYAAAGGGALDVAGICDLARCGDDRAATVLREAMTVLAETVSPWLQRFAAELLVVGGSIARSWDVLGQWFAAPVPEIVVVPDTELMALTGAARFGAAASGAATAGVA